MVYKLWGKLKKYSELVMFSHTLFSLPFAGVSMIWAARGLPEPRLLLWILIALFAARNGANAFNRYADCEIDAKNPRTGNRQIPQGTVKKNEALGLALVLFIVFETAAFQINFLCFVLSPFALFLFFLYSYTKRFTWLCHIILGVACGGAPVGAWLAVTGTVSITPFIIGAGVTFWVAGFDILYGTQDIEFDRENGLFSIPARFGLKGAFLFSGALHVLAIAIFTSLYFIIPTRGIYLLGIGICAVLLLVEHALVKPEKKGVMQWVSYHINQLVALVFFVFSIVDFYV